MPKSTVQEGGDLYPLPLDTVFDGQLIKCEAVTVPFTYKSGDKKGQPGQFSKWEWTIVVMAPGEWQGTEVRGSTEPKITDASESDFMPLARPYVEAFLGRGIAVGEEIDTDDLLGLWCKFTVKHLEPRARKQGDGFWYNVEVNEIFPHLPTNGTEPVPVGAAAPGDPWAAPSDSEPPF